MLAYLTAAIKNVGDTRVGDTITLAKNAATEPLTWLSQIKSDGILWALSN